MSKATAYLVVLATFCGAFTHAIAPCNTSIIEKLSLIKECYHLGQVPRLMAGEKLLTYVMVSKADITSNVSCVVGFQNLPKAYATAYFYDGSSVLNTYYQERHCNYILEKDAKGNYYRIYTTHSRAGVYAYYRCIPEHETNKGNGADMIALLVGCDCLNSKETRAVLEQAKICFTKLGITNTVSIKPCHC